METMDLSHMCKQKNLKYMGYLKISMVFSHLMLLHVYLFMFYQKEHGSNHEKVDASNAA